MKKKLVLLLIPFILSGLTGCVKYNGRGKQGNRTSSQQTSEQSGEPGSSADDSAPSGDNSSGNSGSQNPQPQPQPTPASDELPAGTEVKVYLVFGEYALYKNQPVADGIESLFLEHAIELDAKVGDQLPNAEEVTSTVEGSKFVSWISYNNDGKLTEYKKVPGYKNKILYASFSGGTAGGVNPGGTGGGGQVVPVTPGATYHPASEGFLPATGYGLVFSDGKFMEGVHTNDYDGFEQYMIDHKAFTAGQVFQLYNFDEKAGWTVPIDPWSFGGTSDTSEAWKAYIQRDTSDGAHQTYKVIQDFNAESIYIKIKYTEDQIYFQLGA